MLASILLNDEVVGCVFRRGNNKRNVVKTRDDKMKVKLSKLFNSAFDATTFETVDGDHGADVTALSPGTEEHFIAVAFAIRERSPYNVELIGA